MTRIRGSIARAAFDDAREVLGEHRPGPVAPRVPFDYRPPSGTVDTGAAVVGGAAVDGGVLASAAADLRAGRVTSVELVQRALAAVDARDPDLVGMAHVDAVGALAAAERIDAVGIPPDASPLHGIPITVKDVIAVAGMPTRAGSDAYEHLEAEDAVAVARLRAAGAVIVGKATTHEFALGVTSPQSRNPHDVTRLPGGSSGGSAISVATGMALASLGTDTRASIRVPAALSGVVGFKPTYGRVSTEGVLALSWTMDHAAVMAGSVGDAAVVTEAVLDRPEPLAAARLAEPVRVGVPPATLAGVEPGIARSFAVTLDRLEAQGFEIVEVVRPDADDLAIASAAGMIVSRCEAASMHGSLGLDRGLYWDEVAEQLDLAAEIPATEYLDAQRVRAQLAEDLAATLATVDVLAMPTAPVVAPPADDFADYLMLLARNAIPWSFVGFPAISVPIAPADGLPVGFQVVGPPHADALVIAAARCVEGAGA